MHLTISSPEQQLYTGTIQKITIPTQIGEITVLPGHQPLISVVKGGLIRFTPDNLPETNGYLIQDGQVVVSVSAGLVAVTGQSVVVTTSVATESPSETAEVLEKMHQEMLAKIEKIKDDGNQDELEEALENMEKITADLRLAKMKHVIH